MYLKDYIFIVYNIFIRYQPPMISKEELSFYVQHGPRTKVKKWTFKDFPDDIWEICKIIQWLLIHPNVTKSLYNLNISPERISTERHWKTVQESIDRIIELSNKPLTEYRNPKDRVVNICKHFSMFMCSILKEKWIPARCRCGFGTYFKNWQFSDHRICEYRDTKKKSWSRVDAQIDDIHALKNNLNRDIIDFTDMPKDIFFTGWVLWKLYRMWVVSWDLCWFFAIDWLHGERYIRGNMLRDFFALNNIEYDYMEESKLMERWSKPNNDELLLLDKIADLTIHADEHFDELRTFYAQHKELRP